MSAIPAPVSKAAGYVGTIPMTARSSHPGLALVVIASAQLMVVLIRGHLRAMLASPD